MWRLFHKLFGWTYVQVPCDFQGIVGVNYTSLYCYNKVVRVVGIRKDSVNAPDGTKKDGGIVCPVTLLFYPVSTIEHTYLTETKE